MVSEKFKKACNEATDFPDVKRIVSLVVIDDECFV